MRAATAFDDFDDVPIRSGERPVDDIHLDDLLEEACRMGASDIHLTAGLAPSVRVDGDLVRLNYVRLSPQEVQRLVYDILSDDQIEQFERHKELDFSYSVKSIGRFRVNVYKQRGSVGAALRSIPDKIPTFEQLGIPLVLRDLSRKQSGLILVTGPTGSGKSTTIACMIDSINAERPVHIMSIEDPIEYLHRHKKAMVNQRELHTDTDSFENALRSVLREDPDVILVGEMRDLETINAALTLAETGHLVFGTLHTRNAPQTVDRVIDVFPPHQQDQIRVLLSNTLEAVVAQQLMPRIGGGRIAVMEIMIATSAVRNNIREGKTHQLYSAIETGAQYGMQTMDKVLCEAYQSRLIIYDEALKRAIDSDNFKRLLRGG